MSNARKEIIRLIVKKGFVSLRELKERVGNEKEIINEVKLLEVVKVKRGNNFFLTVPRPYRRKKASRKMYFDWKLSFLGN